MSLGQACLLCGSSEDDILRLGKVFHLAEGSVVHHYCLLFSSNLRQNGDDNEGAEGFLHKDIFREVVRCRSIVCRYCGLPGASAICCRKQCRHRFHVSCLQNSGGLLQFTELFRCYCRLHRLRQKLDLTAVDAQCGICMEEADTGCDDDTLCSPCCKHMFHKTCLQKMAYHFGYFFACPGCRNKDEHGGFIKKMKIFGIFVPQRDASWEMTPGAYQELLERYSHCDARRCLCPRGRDHHVSDKNSRWYLLTCSACGSAGTHVRCLSGARSGCGALSVSATGPLPARWSCSVCRVVVREPATTRATATAVTVSRERARVKCAARTFVERHARYSEQDESVCDSDEAGDAGIWRFDRLSLSDVLQHVQQPNHLVRLTVHHLKGLSLTTRRLSLCHGTVQGGLPVSFSFRELLPAVVISAQERQQAQHALAERARFVGRHAHVSVDQSAATCSGESAVACYSSHVPVSVSSAAALDGHCVQSPAAVSVCSSPISVCDPLCSDEYDIDPLVQDDASITDAHTARSSPASPMAIGETGAIEVDSLISGTVDSAALCATVAADSDECDVIGGALSGFQCPVCREACVSLAHVTVHYHTHAEALAQPPLYQCRHCHCRLASVTQCERHSCRATSCSSDQLRWRDRIWDRFESGQCRVAWLICGAQGLQLSESAVAAYLSATVPAVHRPVSVVKPFSINSDELAIAASGTASGRSAAGGGSVRGSRPSSRQASLLANGDQSRSSSLAEFSIDHGVAEELAVSSLGAGDGSALLTPHVAAAPGGRAERIRTMSARPLSKRKHAVHDSGRLFSAAGSGEGATAGDARAVTATTDDNIPVARSGNSVTKRKASVLRRDDIISDINADAASFKLSHSSAFRQRKKFKSRFTSRRILNIKKYSCATSVNGVSVGPGSGATGCGAQQLDRGCPSVSSSSHGQAPLRNARRPNSVTRECRRAPSTSASAGLTVSSSKTVPKCDHSHRRMLCDVSLLRIGENRWDCPSCDCFYLCRQKLAAHLIDSHLVGSCRLTRCMNRLWLQRSPHALIYHKRRPAVWTVCPEPGCRSPVFTSPPLSHQCRAGADSGASLPCPFADCGVACDSESQLNEHLIVCHSLQIRGSDFRTVPSYRCPFCNVRVRFLGWYSHIWRRHKQAVFERSSSAEPRTHSDDDGQTAGSGHVPCPVSPSRHTPIVQSSHSTAAKPVSDPADQPCVPTDTLLDCLFCSLRAKTRQMRWRHEKLVHTRQWNRLRAYSYAFKLDTGFRCTKCGAYESTLRWFQQHLMRCHDEACIFGDEIASGPATESSAAPLSGRCCPGPNDPTQSAVTNQPNRTAGGGVTDSCGDGGSGSVALCAPVGDVKHNTLTHAAGDVAAACVSDSSVAAACVSDSSVGAACELIDVANDEHQLLDTVELLCEQSRSPVDPFADTDLASAGLLLSADTAFDRLSNDIPMITVSDSDCEDPLAI